MKKLIFGIIIVGSCVSGCASVNQNVSAKKKMTKYNMFMNDHPDRDNYRKY